MNEYITLFAAIPAFILSVVILIFLLKQYTGLLKHENTLSGIHQYQKELAQLFTQTQQAQQERIHQMEKGILDAKAQQQSSLNSFKEQIQEGLHQHRSNFDKRQIESLTLLQESIQKNMQDVRDQVTNLLTQHADNINKRVDKLTENTDQRLRDISGQVEKRLSEGFEKTTATFADILKRLALIDEAQKKITELSGNVVSLQEVLVDRKSRGAFGEVQLSALIRNVLPESCCSFQHTLSNNKRADCILFLPEPTGNIVIDAKFPLENFRKATDVKLHERDKQTAEQQFKIDIRKHVTDIAEKYIIPGETSDGAVMFIPAEAVFAEIHANYPELVDEAQRQRVWFASPTTMMAILTTARAVLKDADTQKQVHVIQEHLGYLSKDFDRFQKRMENLARHIEKANEDVKDVNTSAKKITNRFQKIEKVEFEKKEMEALELAD